MAEAEPDGASGSAELFGGRSALDLVNTPVFCGCR